MDVFPLPRIDDILDTLAGAWYFTKLDLASDFWQVKMDAESQEKTAHSGLYEFKVMPFGLCNSPATFQRLIETVLTAGAHPTVLYGATSLVPKMCLENLVAVVASPQGSTKSGEGSLCERQRLDPGLRQIMLYLQLRTLPTDEKEARELALTAQQYILLDAWGPSFYREGPGTEGHSTGAGAEEAV